MFGIGLGGLCVRTVLGPKVSNSDAVLDAAAELGVKAFSVVKDWTGLEV